MSNLRVVATRRGGPEVLEAVEEPVREPGPGEICLRVLATGVSFADLLMCQGLHPERRRTPFTPGWDLIGEAEGRRYAALTIAGGWSRFVCLPRAELVEVPEGLDPATAVALVMDGVVAHQMLHRVGRVQAGQRVFVNGAAGGVGNLLLQLGRLASLEQYGTASASKHELVRELGTIPIDYRTEDFVSRLRAETAGVDAAFDGVGETVWRARRALRRGGCLVVFGMSSMLAQGRRSPIRLLRTLGAWGLVFALNAVPGGKRTRLYSIQMLKRRHPEWYADDLRRLFRRLGAGDLRPVIAERLPLVEAPAALERVAGGRVRGKIVLVP